MNPSEHRYRAFISYSQRDREHAKRLHTALESYRVPKGVSAPLLPNRRLGRFFRDDDETGASNDLGATLREALEQSENLIVICSPHAARSKWVNAEIEHFKAMGRAERVFAVIADGMPNSGDPETECFPPALRPEPLGIDLRRERFARTRIRLVAGLLGINFDDLWQRERRRAARRRVVAGLVSAPLAAVIAVLGVQWFRERGRARAQRVDRTLVRVRDDLASERVRAALVELGSLYDEGERGAVEDVLKRTLSWAAATAELLKEVRPPAFITNGPAFVFVASDCRRVNVSRPERRILSSDKRRLLIIGSDAVVALDTTDGRELARTSSNQIKWTGSAFETPDKLILVAGQFAGTSNGTLSESLLVFSPKRQVFVTDAGAVEASCGEKEYRREQAAFGGDVRARLREILSDESEAAP
ncbi:MAG: toll/interleukin-1 receptor domain-containing protein [Pyrinomonadaceae bacterium]